MVGGAQGCSRTTVRRRWRGGTPPPMDPPLPPLLLPFLCSRLTAKILLRRLRCQEDLRFKISGPPSAGTTWASWEEGAPSQPSPHCQNPPPPPLPPLSNTSRGGFHKCGRRTVWDRLLLSDPEGGGGTVAPPPPHQIEPPPGEKRNFPKRPDM